MADDIQQPLAASLEAPITPQVAPQEALVNVTDPTTGDVGSIPQSQLQSYIDQGFEQMTPEMIHAHTLQEKHGDALGQLKTGLEGAASAATFGLSTAAELAAGVKPQDIRERREANPGVHNVGQVVGLVGSAFLPGGAEADAAKAAEVLNPFSAASVLGKAGHMAQEAVGLAKPATFVERIGAGAVDGAFQTALMQGGDELSKAFTQDPGQLAETAIADIGMSTIMGGIFGGALGAASHGLKQLGKAPGEAPPIPGSETPGSVGGLDKHFIPGADRAAADAGDLKVLTESDPTIPQTKKDRILDALNLKKPKANAKELKQAQEILGAPETPGMLLDSPVIGIGVDTLAHSPWTFAGDKVRTALDKAYTHVDGVLQKATESANSLSKDALGQELQKSITEQTRAAFAPSEAAFNEVKALHPNVPINPSEVVGFRNGLQDIKEFGLKGSDLNNLAKKVTNWVEEAKNADDISVIRNSTELKSSGLGDPTLHFKNVLKDKLEQLQESAVERYAKSFPRNDEAGAVMQSLIEQQRGAKELYKPEIRKLSELSDWLGKGKIAGKEHALGFINDKLSASDVAQRLFTSSKDPQFLRFFSKEFPEQFKMVRDYQRMALRDSAKIPSSGEFSSNKFFSAFNKMEPELQKALYSPEEIKTIKAAQVYMTPKTGAFPKNYNPSGTSHIDAFRHDIPTPKSILLANARDAAMAKFIDLAGNEQAKNAVELAKATVKGNNLLKSSISAIFRAGKAEMPASITAGTDAHRAKIDKMVAEFTEHPEKMMNIGANNPVQSYNTAFGAATARTVSYLNSVKPALGAKVVLDSTRVASSDQKAKYNRALDIAEQPLRVMDHIKRGTLTPEDVKAISAMYPALYQHMVQRLNDQMIDTLSKGGTVPYNVRGALGTFMAQPLDTTFTPAGISGAQPAPASAPDQPKAPAPKRGTASLSKIPAQYQTKDQARDARANKP